MPGNRINFKRDIVLTISDPHLVLMGRTIKMEGGPPLPLRLEIDVKDAGMEPLLPLLVARF
jgi:hypothetical protein